MSSSVLKSAALFLLLTLAQIVLFNNIELWGYLTPYAYLLFIFLLPARISRTLLVLLGFAQGLIVDLYTSTLGLHTAATTLVAFLRPHFLLLFAEQRNGKEEWTPSIAQLGVESTLKYNGTLIAIHHLVLYFLSAFSFAHFGASLLKALLNALFTLATVLLLQYLFSGHHQGHNR